MPADSSLSAGVAGRIRQAGIKGGDTVVVGLSGGLDSCVLTHLLAFVPMMPRVELVLAHFDHRMRPVSHHDAHWVRGLARAWQLPCEVGVAEEVPASEAGARTARYRFLREVQQARSAPWLLTAHTADDQAETVLFRALRGTGPAGLAGIPERGPGGLLRPLLPFSRAALEAYARAERVPERPDPSNRDLRYARNALRLEILPRAEALVAPGARRALVRLAGLARREEEAWRSLLPGLLEGLGATLADSRVTLPREPLLRHEAGVRARILREAVRHLGGTLGESGTRTALEFSSSGASGRGCELPGGLILARDFGDLVFSRGAQPGWSSPLLIPGPEEGEAPLTLAGRSYRVAWMGSGVTGEPWAQSFASGRLAFPLRLRGWLPGDRIRLAGGSRKLKKLFSDARVPAGDRSARPILVDADGRVLWVPGLARSVEAPDGEEGEVLIISLTEIDTA